MLIRIRNLEEEGYIAHRHRMRKQEGMLTPSALNDVWKNNIRISRQKCLMLIAKEQH